MVCTKGIILPLDCLVCFLSAVCRPESSLDFILCHVAQLDKNSRLYHESRGFENVSVPLLFISPLTQTYFRMSLVSAPSRLKGKTRAEKKPG